MKSRSPRPLTLVLFVLALVFFLCFDLIAQSPLTAQQPRVLAPHRPVPPKVAHPVKWHEPAVLRSMVGGFWMIDGNFKSTIYLKNVVETDSITITPILYLSNGHRYTLRAVKLEPAGVATVNINQGLADQGIASWATLTGYVEIDYTWPWNALCVSVENVDVAHSLIFSSGFRASLAGAPVVPADSTATQEQVFEGMWWKQKSSVTGFVALSNTSLQAIIARIQVSDSRAEPVAEHSVTVSPHGTKIVSLRELPQITTTSGGIRIAYDGSENALIVNGELEDQGAGYSAGIPFIRQKSLSEKPATSTYAELGLMIGAADPMMSFPAGTTFTPYSVMRNVSSMTIAAIPTLWWMEGALPHSKQLPQFQLQSGRSESLDVPSLVSLAGLKNYNGSVNVTFEVQGTPSGLLMAGGSVDQRNTYVFEVGPTLIQESQARSLSYWDTANGDDTMVTLWNPADEPQDFVFKLFFTGGHYNFPIHLGPRASYTFNVSEVINNQIPDSEGNLIPPSVHAGSADLEGTQGANEDILVAMDAGTYNVNKATCIMRCRTCHGAVNFWVQTVPFGVAVSGQKQLNSIVQYDSGAQSDLTSTSSWSSSATSIATVSSGLVQGLSPGGVNIAATSPRQTIPGTDCEPYTPPPCPQTPMQSGGPGTVTPTISGPATLWWFNGLSLGVSGYSNQITLTAQPTSGTYSWAITSGSDRVSLSSTATNTVTVTSIGQSKMLNDVSITATVGGETSNPFELTVRAPYALATDPLHASPVYLSNGTFVWENDIYHTVVDNFLTALPANVPVNENWNAPLVSDYPGTNWRQPAPNALGCAATFGNAELEDIIGGEAASRIPTPVYNPSQNGAAVQHWGQEWRIGTCITGAGPRVETDSLQKYVDHAAYNAVVTPAP